ncbi:MAG TPA: thioredoxin domain-containing protein, partial [Pyrinomonadaceae bacterium]|nr:thioredoxin domain-containing protein [Pyrinomonadaceae bacterium]
EVLAVVNGVRVTKADLSPQTQQRLQQLYRQVREVRRNEVRLLVNTKLLEAEAKKRNTTTTKLFEDEVVKKAAAPTEADALAFFNQNKERIQQSAGRGIEFNEIKTNIIEHLKDERNREATQQFADRLRAASNVQITTEVATPPATPADRARVLATVNGERITSADVEDDLRPLIYNAQEQAYELVKQDVEMRINDILLEQEAQKRKVTTNALLETEVRSKVPAVTDAQAQAFFNENKERINGTFDQLKPQIIQYLQQNEGRKAESAFAEQLRRAAAVETFVRAPAQPVFTIATDDQPSKGNPSAAVTLVEFTDFQCPACAQTHPVIERLATEYADRVRFVLRDFPLSQHENAFKAAEAAEAAREQGKYWEYIAVLFRNQQALQVPKLKEYAAQVGLDLVKFSSALDSGRFSDKVRRDMQDGNRVGVNGTPSLFINGRRITDRSYEGLKAALDAALRGGTATR